MILTIKNRIESEISKFIRDIDKLYSLKSISPVLFNNIKEFVSRKGKRIRPILFIIGYLGFARKSTPGLYRSAVSLELLHDFMLVHDDIIDKSQTRRGKPSMHARLNRYLKGYRNLKFCGQDLAIVIGDVMYAMAIHAFLSVNENKQRKEMALKRLVEAAFYTGSGEFIELLCGTRNIEEITKEDIYKIYDLKTANYTFASPLTIGATLAGSGNLEVNKLFKYGTYLGRAFQIKDDVLGMFGKEAKTGKSTLTDLKEAKKTILIWYAYNHSNSRNKSLIRKILKKMNVNKTDLSKIQNIIIETNTLDYVKKEILKFTEKAQAVQASIRMHPKYKELLSEYSNQILSL